MGTLDKNSCERVGEPSGANKREGRQSALSIRERAIASSQPKRH